MPKIETYEAPQLGLNPSEEGVQSFAAAGRRLGGFYNQLAQATERVGEQAGRGLGSAIKDAGDVYVAHEDHQQISAGAAVGATMFDDLTQERNKIIANIDPSDPLYAQKVEGAIKQWRQDSLEPRLQKFSEGFQTERSQAWAERYVDNIRQHMFTSSAAEISTAAGIGIQNSVKTIGNQSSNTAYNDPDLSTHSMDVLMNQNKLAVDGLVDTSRLTAEQAATFKASKLFDLNEAVVKAKAQAYIERTGHVPPWAQDPNSPYAKYMKAPELEQFRKAADQWSRAKEGDARRLDLLQKQQLDNAAKKGAADFISKNFQVDPDNPNRYLVAPDAKQKALDYLKNNHDAPSSRELFENISNLVDHSNKPGEIVSNPQAVADFWTKLADPNTSPIDLELDVRRNESKRQVTTQEANNQIGAIRAMKTDLDKDPILKARIDAIKERVGFDLMGNGKEQFSNAMAAFLPAYQQAKRSPGGLPANAFNFDDPNSLVYKAIHDFEPKPQDRYMAHQLKLMGIRNAGDLNLPGFNTPPASQAPKAGGAPVNATPPAMKLPPLADRKKDQVYPTPSGHMRWTGTGWAPP